MVRSLSLVVAVLIAWSMVGIELAGASRQATPSLASSIEQRPIQIPDATLISLSPDGRWLVVLRQTDESSDVCAFDAAMLAEHACAAAEIAAINATGATWSPDGTRFAFTDDWPMFLQESDLWVFAPETGTLVNLTDDRLARSVISPTEAPLDLAPSWSPDGADLAFVRSDADDSGQVSNSIYRIAADGGEPVRLATLGEFPDWAPSTTRWTPAGDAILFSHWPLSVNVGGISSVPAAGGDPQLLFEELPALDGDIPVLVEVRPPSTALVVVPHAPQEPGSTRFALIDLEDGDVAPLTPLAPESQGGYPIAATFSPNGASIALIYSRPDGTQFLAVRPIDGAEETIVADLDTPLQASAGGGGLAWAAGDLLFHRGDGSTGALISLPSA